MKIISRATTVFLLLCTSGIADAVPHVTQTQLSEKVRLMPDGLYKADVIKRLGKPSHAYIPRDFREQHVDGDESLAYILVWENSPCSSVEISFDHSGKVTGSDGGVMCEGQQSKPKAKYSCAIASRASYCR